MTTSISCTELTKDYGEGRLTNRVLKGIDLEILSGELTLLMGPSGCGKSTLLAALSGLSRPTSGSVVSMGKDLHSMSDQESERFRLAHCGFVFQGFNLFSSLNAVDQVAFPLKYSEISTEEAYRRARVRLEQVGLSHRSTQYPETLSGGEKQRVAIARALAKRPRLIFADEPTSALDSTNGQMVIELLREEATRSGATIFCVTHDQRLRDKADRVLMIDDGRIVQDIRA